MKRLALAIAIAASLAAFPGLADAKTTVQDVEDEVMCPICGTLLELSNSPQAQRERVYVAKLVAEGKSKDEVKDALVAQYGKGVLALPEGSGFDLSAYLVPVIALAIAVAALAFSVLRWRRDGSRSPSAKAAAPPPGEDAERLEADLGRYDL